MKDQLLIHTQIIRVIYPSNGGTDADWDTNVEHQSVSDDGGKSGRATCIRARADWDGLRKGTAPERSCFTSPFRKRNMTRTRGPRVARSLSSSFSESCRHSNNQVMPERNQIGRTMATARVDQATGN